MSSGPPVKKLKKLGRKDEKVTGPRQTQIKFNPCFSGVERSFSSMNRVCTKLRQRMTPDHLSQLLLISIEGPEVLSRREIVNVVYIWYTRREIKIDVFSFLIECRTYGEKQTACN